MDLIFLLLMALPIVVPAAMYFSGRSAGRKTWGLVLRGYEKHGNGAYRVQVRPVWAAGKPPLSVHLAAISSFILGQMVVPGAFAALIGLVVSFEILFRGPHSPGEYVVLILIASVPTGLMIGGRLLNMGLILLQREPGAAQKARDLARFSLIHNVVLILLEGLVFVFGGNDAVYFPVAYQCVSIAQALLLLKAASALDSHDAIESRDRELALQPPQWVDHPV